jgi:hypothetical protein
MAAQDPITITCDSCNRTFDRDRRHVRYVGDADLKRAPGQESVALVLVCSED